MYLWNNIFRCSFGDSFLSSSPPTNCNASIASWPSPMSCLPNEHQIIPIQQVGIVFLFRSCISLYRLLYNQHIFISRHARYSCWGWPPQTSLRLPKLLRGQHLFKISTQNSLVRLAQVETGKSVLLRLRIPEMYMYFANGSVLQV